MIFESEYGAFAVISVAIGIAVGESRRDLSQIVCPDRLTARRTDGLPARRPAIHQDESHVAPANTICVARFANRRRESSTAGACIKGSLRSLLVSKSLDCDRNSWVV
jgi:hypothetical protein